jgi:hypothetical protein
MQRKEFMKYTTEVKMGLSLYPTKQNSMKTYGGADE